MKDHDPIAAFEAMLFGGNEKMTREEHLVWAKQRALEYVEAGDMPGALGSLTSDLSKHAELRDHPGIDLGLKLLIAYGFTPAMMRRFIEGFD